MAERDDDEPDDRGGDFDADELAMLRQLFRDEAHEALEAVTARALATGAGPPAPDAVGEMMRVTHTLKGSAGTVGMDAMVDLAHRLESALALLRGGGWTAAVADQIIEIADGMRLHVDALDRPDDAAAQATRVRGLVASLASALGGRVESSPRGPRLAVPPRPRPPTDSDGVVATPIELGDTTRTIRTGADLSAAVPDGRAMLRVEPERVDALMSAAGELLFDRTRIERRVHLLRSLARDLTRSRHLLRDEIGPLRVATGDADRARIEGRLVTIERDLAAQATQLTQTTAALFDETEALRRTIGELQKGLLRMRMQTARSLFARLARSLRAFSRTAGARIELRTHGDDTEFDKALAEQLADPLVQIVRNAIVHGIEPAVERVARGKSPVGTLTIAARQEGGLVIFELTDDGRGIDPHALRERFVATGRWTPARAQLASDADVLHALFDAGVSSKDEADELAGRGIGLDLVRETVARLGGEIQLQSTPGRGTTFTLRLPVTTAVAQAMLFKVGGQVYALPQVHVVETTQIDGAAQTVPLRHEQLPVVRLEQLLATGGAAIDSGPVAESTGRRTAIVVAYAGKGVVCTVDKIVGPREIVVRPLGPLLAPLPLYAGATISGSGKVQLILDPAALVRIAHPGAVAIAPSAGGATTSSAGRALVVDDSRAIREALTAMLARDGWIVDVAEDGAGAWHMVQQLRYDLLITDLEMPRMNGFELIARLRRDKTLADLPVVVITSRASSENRRRARELGARAMVGKPITRRKLQDAIAGT
ncbi:MAG: response regulator [Deltaproteobacteria bacterium]|nr:response regulator [Deltaproteobacteria bacterium]